MIDQGLEPPQNIKAVLTSDDFSDHSSISEDGLPDKDLEFCVEPNLTKQIEDRRKHRRLSKDAARADHAAMTEVLSSVEKFHKKSPFSHDPSLEAADFMIERGLEGDL